MKVAQNSTHTSLRPVYAPCCRSPSRLPGSRYARDISQPGPANRHSFRHDCVFYGRFVHYGPCQSGGGSAADLERFAELLGRVERTGGWPELNIAIRTEVINFSTKHTRDLEEHARTMGKATVFVKDRPNSNDTDTPVGSFTGAIVPVGGPPEESLIGDLDLTTAPSPAPNSFKGVGLPLLPPPPPPAKGVSMGQLI